MTIHHCALSILRDRIQTPMALKQIKKNRLNSLFLLRTDSLTAGKSEPPVNFNNNIIKEAES